MKKWRCTVCGYVDGLDKGERNSWINLELLSKHCLTTGFAICGAPKE
ncbi:MAG: hypothetical protein QXX08_00800 [Candidatus Bathyarchaeia archaeon]